MNYQTYAEGIFALSSDENNAGQFSFTQGKLYTKAEADGSLTTVDSLTAASGSGCTIQNAVKEVFYTVYYAPFDGLYSIREVVYDIVVQDSLTLGSACSGGSIDPASPALIQMDFGIVFLPYTESKEIVKSGNPGYQTGRPLLIATDVDEQGLFKVPRNGFYVSASDQKGQCLPSGKRSATPLRVDFHDDILLMCQVA